MSTSVDLSRTSGLIDLGTHTFKITSRSSEEMGPSGDPYWRLICQVISKGDNQGKELMHQVSLGQASRWKMDEFLDGISAPKRGKWTLEQCIGKTFRASVGQDVYNGKIKSVIEAFVQAGDSQQSFEELPSDVAQHDAALPDDVLLEDDSEISDTDFPDKQSPTSRRGRF